MKVIFLDFDGVLNSQKSFDEEIEARDLVPTDVFKTLGPLNETLCRSCTSNFQLILDKFPDAKIVISSTWRLLFTLEWLKDKLFSYGIDSSRVIGITPSSVPSSGDWRTRGNEIRAWLLDHPEVTKFIVIDDDPDAVVEVGTFIKTTWEDGLTLEKTEEAIKKFEMQIWLGE